MRSLPEGGVSIVKDAGSADLVPGAERPYLLNTRSVELGAMTVTLASKESVIRDMQTDTTC